MTTLSKTERRFGNRDPLTPVQHARKRLSRYLRDHPEGVSTAQLYGWIGSVRRGGIIGLRDFNAALREMRDDGTAACANELWGLRRARPPVEPSRAVDSFDLPADGLFTRFRG